LIEGLIETVGFVLVQVEFVWFPAVTISVYVVVIILVLLVPFSVIAYVPIGVDEDVETTKVSAEEVEVATI